MTFDAASWLGFVAITLGYFLFREGLALLHDDDKKFTLSHYIGQIQDSLGRAGGRTITGVIIVTLAALGITHLVAWAI